MCEIFVSNTTIKKKCQTNPSGIQTDFRLFSGPRRPHNPFHIRIGTRMIITATYFLKEKKQKKKMEEEDTKSHSGIRQIEYQTRKSIALN